MSFHNSEFLIQYSDWLHILPDKLFCYAQSAHIAAALELGCSLLRAKVSEAHGPSHDLTVLGNADAAADSFLHGYFLII